MLKKLSLSHYNSVLPLFGALDDQLVIRSAVEGHTNADFYADRLDGPRLALFWDRIFALAVAGQDQELMSLAALRNLIHNHLLPDARSRHIPYLALHAGPAWMAMAPTLLHGLRFSQERRRSFRLAPDSPPPSLTALPALPQGLSLMPLTAELLASPTARDPRGWVMSFWPSVDEFLRLGFGWAVMDGETPAAWCLTVFAATARGLELELGLETSQTYRGRGLGTLTAAACVRQAQERGALLHWQCWASNRPSEAIAERLGFAPEREYSVYRFETGLP